jgi:hypothetical protein
VALVCTASWVAYGFASRDYNMFLANIPGFTATLYTTVTSHALATRKVIAQLRDHFNSSIVCVVLLQFGLNSDLAVV